MTKTMFICSTQNQVVNLVPAITEKVENIVIFTTETAKNWTKNLINFLKKRNVKYRNVDVIRTLNLHKEIILSQA